MTTLNLITTPTVRVLARPTLDPAALAGFLAEQGAPDWTTDTDVAAQVLIEVAGRSCYRSYKHPRPGGNQAYINHILGSMHGSVTEHAVFTFLISGVSRSLTHELVRHRAGWSYSQESQRFVDKSECAFVVPPLLLPFIEPSKERFQRWDAWMKAGCAREHILEDPGAGIQALWNWEAALRASISYYRAMLSFCEELAGNKSDRTARRKTAREAARSVLPNCTATTICATANTRSIRNFLEQRGSPGADAEIRRLAVAILRLMQAEAPNLFADFAVVTAEDGAESLTCKYHKV